MPRTDRIKEVEFLKENPNWGVLRDYPARKKIFGTTRLVDNEVPKSGDRYRWDIDDSYDITMEKVFGTNVSSDVSLGATRDLLPLLHQTGTYAVNFALIVYERPKTITRADVEGIQRVDALFDRLGFMTLQEARTNNPTVSAG